MSLELIILIAGGGIALVVLLIGVFISGRAETSELDDRLEEAIQEDVEEEYEDVTEKEQRRPVTDWLNTRLTGSSWAEKTSDLLAKADIKMRPGEYAALLVVAAFGGALIVYFISGNMAVGIFGALIGFFLPGMYVKRTQKGRLKSFDD